MGGKYLPRATKIAAVDQGELFPRRARFNICPCAIRCCSPARIYTILRDTNTARSNAVTTGAATLRRRPQNAASATRAYPALSSSSRSGGSSESSKQTSIGAERTDTFSRYDGTRLSSQDLASTCKNRSTRGSNRTKFVITHVSLHVDRIED